MSTPSPSPTSCVAGQVCIVTGGGNGIGAGLARRFAADGAAHVAIFDRDGEAASRLAAELRSASAQAVDVANESQYAAAIRRVLGEHGRVDLLASNAGVQAVGGVDASDEDWSRAWDVNVLSLVYATRVLLPHFVQRGSGTILQTASAGGLLCEIGSAAYSATKSAVISLCEWISINYRRKGVDVSVLCPAGVRTEFLTHDDPAHSFLHTHAVSVEDVADAAIAGLTAKSFLIVPEVHEPVREFFRFKGEDYDRWLHNFSRIAQRMERAREKAERSAAPSETVDPPPPM